MLPRRVALLCAAGALVSCDQQFDVNEFISAGDVASFLGLHEPPPLALPVMLNVVMIGFSGESGLNVSEAQLRPWFEQLQSRLPHAVLPASAASEGGSGSLRRQAQKHPPVPSAVEYRYHTRLHVLPPEVTVQVEAVIAGHLRPEEMSVGSTLPLNTAAAEATLQISAPRMNALLSSLLDALQLPGFCLLLLNPQRLSEHRYGYRAGFSLDEMQWMRQSEEMAQLLQSARHLSAGRRGPSLATSFFGSHHKHQQHHAKPPLKPPPKSSGKGTKAKPSAAQPPSSAQVASRARAWANGEAMTLRVGALKGSEQPLEDRATPQALLGGVAALLSSAPAPLDATEEAGLGEAEAARRSREVRAYGAELHAVEEAMRHEATPECLTDLYLTERLAWVDLGAGPFAWGPVVGGEGVRTHSSLPDLRGAWQGPEPDLGVAKGGEEETGPSVQELDAERAILHEVTQRTCDGGGARGGAQGGTEGAPEGGEELCEGMRERLRAFEEYYHEALVEAQLKDQQLDTHRQTKSHLAWAGPHKASAAALRGPLYGAEEAEEQVAQGGRWLDPLLSQLAAVAALLMEHVVTPPSAPLLASPYAERVAFHIYLVRNHDAFAPDDSMGLELAALQRQLLTLRQPSQHFSFTTHAISMAEDARLAMAYATSLRHAAYPALALDGALQTQHRAYVDSASLRHALQATHSLEAGEQAYAGPQTSRVLPIFIFSIDSAVPLFIDRQLQARALEDMVLVVQSEHSAWQSHLMCDGRHVQWNLRAPLRATLAAAAQLLGGVQPPHLLYQPELHRVLQNWLWSVGDSPLSTTSHGVDFTAHQADVLARNYVVAGLNASLHLCQQAHATLAPLEASRQTWRLFSGKQDEEGLPLLRLRSAAAKLRELQRRVAGASARLEWGGATALLHSLQRDSEAVLAMAQQVAAAAAARQCDGTAPLLDEGGGRRRWLLALLALPTALLCCCRRHKTGRARPKVNLD